MDTDFPTRMRRRRQDRGLTLAKLASASGVSRAALSKIERGERTPSLINALQIAEGLGLPLAELIDQGQAPVAVTRRDEATRLEDAASGAVREALLQPYPGTEVVRYTLPAGTSVGPFPAHVAGTREGFVVLSGVVGVIAEEHNVELSAGDAAALPADREHTIANLGEDEAVLLLLIGRPR